MSTRILQEEGASSQTKYKWKRICFLLGFPSGSAVKNSPVMYEKQEVQVQSLGQEDPLEECVAIHSRVLAWRIPSTEEPGRLRSIALQSWTWLKQLTRMVLSTTRSDKAVQSLSLRPIWNDAVTVENKATTRMKTDSLLSCPKQSQSARLECKQVMLPIQNDYPGTGRSYWTRKARTIMGDLEPVFNSFIWGCFKKSLKWWLRAFSNHKTSAQDLYVSGCAQRCFL